MSHYRSNLRDIEFNLFEVLGADAYYGTGPFASMDGAQARMVIEEFDAEKGGWLPYKADDVQLEFVMLDPYVRTFLQHDGQGRFAKLFKIPDVYGVYKFRVMYRRPGLSTLAVNTQVRACVGGGFGGLWGLGGRPCPWWR